MIVRACSVTLRVPWISARPKFGVIARIHRPLLEKTREGSATRSGWPSPDCADVAFGALQPAAKPLCQDTRKGRVAPVKAVIEPFQPFFQSPWWTIR